MAEFLAEYDIVVNCVLQDPDEPLTFVTLDELARFAPGTLFVDVSCDEGMGFEWARPTSFADPMFEVGDGAPHYARRPQPVAAVELGDVGDRRGPARRTCRRCSPGRTAGMRDETIRRAIELRDGVVQNPKILSFQGRAAEYPHPRR